LRTPLNGKTRIWALAPEYRILLLDPGVRNKSAPEALL
jgi:hypothetical protein